MMSFDEFRAAWLGSDDPDVKKRNRELIKRYPFLLPRSQWSGKKIEGYDYEFTELDDMPEGWREAFGLKMCEELLHILNDADYAEKYRILQIKEKFGYLHWYSGSVPNRIYDRYLDWLTGYEELSEHTCIVCGKPGHMMNTGWISPYCEDCFHKYFGADKDYEKYRLDKEEDDDE